MTITEIIRQPESKRLEFKELMPSKADLSKTIVAFANQTGGDLFIGIKNHPREIAIFDDKIEITNLGELMPLVDFNLMDAGQSNIRNKILAPIFKKLGIIEQWGNGLRIIAEKLDISTTPIEKNINKLKKSGIIKRMGGDKGGKWEVIKK
jgi:predicted HTH transcriptional regulator